MKLYKKKQIKKRKTMKKMNKCAIILKAILKHIGSAC